MLKHKIVVSILLAYAVGQSVFSQKILVKIADKTCDCIDDKINHNQTQLNTLKHYKQGLLQQLFV